MAAYNYKYVRDQLPPYLTTETENYEGDAGYDGDQWCATCDYIQALESELAKQYEKTQTMSDKKLLNWLKTRPNTIYSDGPAIVVA